MKKRGLYLLATFLLIGIEVCIALFVDDNFVRPYIGDVLVVIPIYTLIRVFVPEKLKLLPLYIFMFATVVEVLQYVQIVNILGLENNTFMRVLIGSVFDIKDILCYGIGCMVLGVFEYWKTQKRKER